MRINELKLKNFGIYAGKQTISFKDTNHKKPIILLGGYNGRGKTTIFEAMLLGLYGSKSFAFLESKLTYAAYLNKFINKNNIDDGASIEIDITVNYDSESANFIIKRTWFDKGKYTKDDLIVKRKGGVSNFYSDNWDNIIDNILPSGISKFFLFDGEKIGEILDDADDKRLRDSIKALLGIDIIERLSEDLKNIISKNKLLQTLEEQSTELRDERLKRDSINDQKGELVRRKADISLKIAQEENRLKEAEAKFSKKGGRLLEKQDVVSVEKEDIEKKIKEVSSAIHENAAGFAPLLMVMPLIQQIADSVRREGDLKNAEYELQGIEKFLQGYINLDESIQFGLQAKREWVAQQRAEVGENLIGMSMAGTEQAITLAELDAQVEFAEIRKLLDKKKELEARLDQTDDYLNVNIDKVALQKLIDQIKNSNIKIARMQVEIETLDASTADLIRKLDDSERIIIKLTEKLLENKEAKDGSVRLVKYSTMARAVLGEYQRRLQEMKIDNLSKLATEKFKLIIGKKTLIQNLVFDKETLSLTMFDKQGNEILKKQLSAGERQLLSTAIVWALGESTGQQFPMIIDTPLARLDTIHRDLFIKNYVPQVSKQTIILSTDAEIVGDLLTDIDLFVARKYLLKFDEKKDATTVIDGYFKEAV